MQWQGSLLDLAKKNIWTEAGVRDYKKKRNEP